MQSQLFYGSGVAMVTPFRGRRVDYDALEAYRDFGGIRIEDDILVTESGSRIIGDRKIPVTVEELEAVVGK